MNSYMKRMIMDKRRKDYGYHDMDDRDYGYRDRRSSDYGRGEYSGEFRGDYESDYDRYDRRRDDYDMPDGRRGVKGTGPYGIGGRRYYGRDRAESDDMRLSSAELREWKEHLENADGSHGAHFEMAQIKQAAKSLGLQMNGYDEEELCVAANMLYSDYCEVFRQFVPRDKEAAVYVKMARAFFDDRDASAHGGEKLAAYYCAIVDDE